MRPCKSRSNLRIAKFLQAFFLPQTTKADWQTRIMKLQGCIESHSEPMNRRTFYRRVREENDIGAVARELLLDRITDERNNIIFLDCPNHASQSHTSMHVDIAKQVWICRGCGVGGGVLELVEFVKSGKVTKGLSGPMPDSHRKARDFLAVRLGMQPLSGSELSPEEVHETEEREAKAQRTYECLTELAA